MRPPFLVGQRDRPGLNAGILMRAWFRLSAAGVLASLALPWISTGPGVPPALGVFVLLFGLFTAPNLPAFLTGRVSRDRAAGDLVSWSDAWLGFWIVTGWAAAVAYLLLARRSRNRSWVIQSFTIALPAVALAAFCGFAVLQESIPSWGFWAACGGLIASLARETTILWTSRRVQAGYNQRTDP